jgi:hypothetical protein
MALEKKNDFLNLTKRPEKRDSTWRTVVGITAEKEIMNVKIKYKSEKTNR